jgi:nicotinamidase-related amidase
MARQTITVELPVPEQVPMRVNPKRSALVIIDMVNDFCTAEGLMSLSPRRVAVVKPIKALLDRCREAAMPIIHVQTVRDPDAPEFVRFHLKPFALRETWGSQIVDDLTPHSDESVVEKHSHDCFNGTRLEAVLAHHNIGPWEWNVIVVGLGLTNCVGCAVSGFSVRHYQKVLLPMDCTASASEQEDICQYQRYLQIGYSYNVALTVSDKISLEGR